MIKKDYSSINVPNSYRLLKEGELIIRDDIYFAEVEGINAHNILSWRKSREAIGRKYSSKSYMPVARKS